MQCQIAGGFMAREDKTSIIDNLTPVPSNDLRALSKNVNTVTTAVVRVEGEVSGILEKLEDLKNDLILPISRNAKEARDGVLKLEQRVQSLEQKEPAVAADEVSEIKSDLTGLATGHAGLLKMVWWFLGVALVVGSGAVGFTIFTRTLATTNATRLENHAGEIKRHESGIKTLEAARRQDQRQLIAELRKIPVKVHQVSVEKMTVEDIADASGDLRLSSKDRESLIAILGRAKSVEFGEAPSPEK